MSPPKNPCKGCENRIIGCHGKCTLYQSYAQYWASIREARRDIVMVNTYVSDQVKKHIQEITLKYDKKNRKLY